MSPRRTWDSPTPSPASGCAPPPPTKGVGAHSSVGDGVGAHSSVGDGVGETQFRRLDKKLSKLLTLWSDLTRRGGAILHMYIWTFPICNRMKTPGV